MIAKCPNCKFEYEVESNGKYLCGVCEKKFFLFKNGTTELATAPDAEVITADGTVSSRQFHAGDIILGHYRVVKMLNTGNGDVVYRCFDEKACEHVMLKDLFPDIAIAEESTARFQKVTEIAVPTETPAAPAPAAAPVAPAPAAAPVAPAPAAAPVAPAPAAVPVAPAPAAAPIPVVPVAPAPAAAPIPVVPVAPAPAAAPIPVVPVAPAPAAQPVMPAAQVVPAANAVPVAAPVVIPVNKDN